MRVNKKKKKKKEKGDIRKGKRNCLTGSLRGCSKITTTTTTIMEGKPVIKQIDQYIC